MPVCGTEAAREGSAMQVAAGSRMAFFRRSGHALHVAAGQAAHSLVSPLGPRTACRRNAFGRTACDRRGSDSALRARTVHHRRLPLGPRIACRLRSLRTEATSSLSKRPERQPHALSGGHMKCADRRRNAFRAECSRRGERSRSTSTNWGLHTRAHCAHLTAAG